MTWPFPLVRRSRKTNIELTLTYSGRRVNLNRARVRPRGNLKGSPPPLEVSTRAAGATSPGVEGDDGGRGGDGDGDDEIFTDL
eukprot:CAMPEP_0185253578 /NCGR_PEP_ID=MMETSP1359-20130426/2269_1 /TAXON_ID=552665 /ORGANISM="Bigelowiella longifila, Strain CCMP242" /LENGTH=82 /DNA_ID=CAMNT_0027835975 /DNA_START=535 /DNA_END=781 /DNA_ORIENTATION=+